MKVYILKKDIPGHAKGTVITDYVNTGGCYHGNQYYPEDHILSFCMRECPEIAELIHTR